MSDSLPVTERTRVRRKAGRARHDRATIHAILDEAMIAAVAVVIDGRPHVQPMIQVRVGDDVILHGLATNRLIGLLAGGAEACLNVTLVDGLVLARRIEDHSLHYRSVTLFATAQEVTDEEDKAALMAAVFAALVRSGRYASLPPLARGYLKGTRVLRLPIVEAVAKVNEELPDADDGPAGIWSGVVPLGLRAGPPLPDRRTLVEALNADESISGYSRTATS